MRTVSTGLPMDAAKGSGIGGQPAGRVAVPLARTGSPEVRVRRRRDPPVGKVGRVLLLRPLESFQLAAATSKQSQPVDSRESLEQRYRALTDAYQERRPARGLGRLLPQTQTV